MRFPYRDVGRRDRPDEPPLLRPYVTLRVIGLSDHAPTVGLLDTGADVTTLSTDFIAAIDVHIKRGDGDVFRGADGKAFEVLYGTIDIELTSGGRSIVHRWAARVAFSDRPMGAGIILGHEGFLEYFCAHFHGPERHVSLRPRKLFPPHCMPVR